MADADSGAPWAYPEGQVELEQSQNIRSDSPLQYAVLFAESQPTDGKVSAKKLNAIISRARIPMEQSAKILELSRNSATDTIDEHDFYWALAQVSCVQSDPDHNVVYTASDEAPNLTMSQIELFDPDEANGGDAADVISECVPEYNPTAEHEIHVSLLTRSAGSFFLKHAVYTLDGRFAGKTVKVLRRFRDFATLLDVLARRFPFRVLPVLPPRRLSLNGKYLVGDTQDAFLSRRTAGLERFVNLLVLHPILSKDSAVETFLFADTQFDSHALAFKAGPDELEGKTASPLFISQWEDSKKEEWNSIENACRENVNQITCLCIILERQLKRIESDQLDVEAVGRCTVALSRHLYPTYPHQQEDLKGIQERLDAVSSFTEGRHDQLATESEKIKAGPLYHLKLYRDMLTSVLELFGRLKSLGGNTIPEQEKAIAAAQRKLIALSTREDVKEEDLHKLRMKIQTAQASIKDQTNRGWMIKMVISQELVMVEKTQYQISRILRSLASYLSSSSAALAELTSQLADSVASAPLNI